MPPPRWLRARIGCANPELPIAAELGSPATGQRVGHSLIRLFTCLLVPPWNYNRSALDHVSTGLLAMPL